MEGLWANRRLEGSSKTASIIEYISVDSDTPIIDEVHMSSDSTGDDVEEIVEPNTPAVPSKSFNFLVLNIVLWSFQSSQILGSHPSSLS